MNRSTAGCRACKVAALVMRTLTVWFLSAAASLPLAMMRIFPWSMRSRPKGGPAQPTSIWADITCVNVAGGLAVATGLAFRAGLLSQAGTVAGGGGPLGVYAIGFPSGCGKGWVAETAR